MGKIDSSEFDLLNKANLALILTIDWLISSSSVEKPLEKKQINKD